jgi:putrescine transport system permease protein
MSRRGLWSLPVWAWLLFFTGAPVLVVAAIALGRGSEGVPPFAPPPPVSWESLGLVLGDPYYLSAFLQSLVVAGLCALGCLLLGFPMALGIARAPAAWRNRLMLLVLLPFWTGFLLRLGAWIGLLRDGGWINNLLLGLGVIQAPLPLLYSHGALMLGMVHAYLPFAVLPLVIALSRLDPELEEAAADLGAGPWRIFASVTLPLAAPGAAAAFLLVFIPAAGEYVIPELLGPPEATMVGRVLWQEFFQNRDWPVASALALVLLLLLLLPIHLFQRLEARR